MGLLLSLPFAGVLGTIGSSCLAGLAFCFTSTAGVFAFGRAFLRWLMHYTSVYVL